MRPQSDLDAEIAEIAEMDARFDAEIAMHGRDVGIDVGIDGKSAIDGAIDAGIGNYQQCLDHHMDSGCSIEGSIDGEAAAGLDQMELLSLLGGDRPPYPPPTRPISPP